MQTFALRMNHALTGMPAFVSSTVKQVSRPLAAGSGFAVHGCYCTITVLAVLAVGVAILCAVAAFDRSSDDEPMGFEEAQAPGMPRMIFWAGRWLAEDWQRYHFAISGITRSGKSILFSLYLRSVIPLIVPGSDQRLILFDPKNELHPALFANVPVPVHFLLPSDERSSRWDYARDFDNPAAVMQFCEGLVPQPHDSNVFFTLAERELIGAVLNSLNQTHWHSWDLTDVVHILKEREFLTQVLRRCPGSRSALRLMGEPRTWANIEATLATHLHTLELMAAMSSRAERTFSLSDFVKSEGILVLGRDPRYTALFDPINTLLLTHLFSHLLAQGDSRTRRTYIAIDELTVAAGDKRPLPGFKDVCERGASRGIVISITYQSYASMNEIYKEGADAILANLQNRVFLVAGDTPTAEFDSKLFGKNRDWIKTKSETSSWGAQAGESRTVSDHYHEEDAVPVEKFFKLSPATPEHGLTGYWLSPQPLRSSAPFHLTGEWIDENLPKKDPDIAPYLERPNHHQHLEPLSYKDLRRLKLTLPEPAEDADDGGAAVVKAARRPSTPPRATDDITGKLRRLIGSAWSPDDDHEA